MFNLTNKKEKNKGKIQLITMLLFTSLLEACALNHKKADNMENIVIEHTIDKTFDMAKENIDSQKEYFNHSKTILENLKREKQRIKEFKLNDNEEVTEMVDPKEEIQDVQPETVSEIIPETNLEKINPINSAETITNPAIDNINENTNEKREEKPNKNHGNSSTSKPETKPNVSETKPNVPETKPSVPVEPETPEIPVEPETPSEPSIDEECLNHIGSWHSLNETLEERTCEICNTTETRKHSLTTETEIESLENGTHKIITTTDCDTCEYTNQEEEIKDCEMSEWTYNGNNTDTRNCNDCEYTETREHVHSEVPEDITYEVEIGTSEDTHILKGEYTCEICNETVTVSKEEDCDYDISYTRNDEKDIHNVIKDCKICNNHIEQQEECIPTGEIKAIGINNVVYDYYDCEKCNDRCQEVKHEIHEYDSWESKGNTHIRYCRCGAREEEDHNLKFVVSDPETNTVNEVYCEDCDFRSTLTPHQHAPNEMKLMDLVFSPYYDYLESKSQTSNPNPSPEGYCSKYVVICPDCGRDTKLIIKYNIEYGHTFENGFCTRGYCNHIAQTPEAIVNAALEQMMQIESETLPLEEEKIENQTTVSGPSLKLVP